MSRPVRAAPERRPASTQPADVTLALRLGAAAAPALFVFLWATGFVVARYGMPHAPPLAFLSVRFGLALVVLLIMARVSAAPWPDASSTLR